VIQDDDYYTKLFHAACHEIAEPWPDAVNRLVEDVQASRKKLAAIREAAEAVQCDATRKVLRILAGPPRG